MSAKNVEELATQVPAWLSEDARGYWADLVRHLPDGLIKPTDAHAFAMLANELATYAEADAAVQRDGILLGEERQAAHPAIAIRNQAAQAVQRWSQYLRITPDDRISRAARERGLRHRKEV